MANGERMSGQRKKRYKLIVAYQGRYVFGRVDALGRRVHAGEGSSYVFSKEFFWR